MEGDCDSKFDITFIKTSILNPYEIFWIPRISGFILLNLQQHTTYAPYNQQETPICAG